MTIRHLMLGLRGRIGRVAFAGGLIAAVVLFAIAGGGSLMLVPALGAVLAPQNIDTGVALKVIWLALGLLFAWSVIALGVKRLRDRGRSIWWIVVVVVPLVALVLLNDAVFPVSSVFRLPRELQLAALIASTLIGLWMLADCLIGISTREPRKRPRARPVSN